MDHGIGISDANAEDPATQRVAATEKKPDMQQSYFETLQQVLKSEGISQPVLVIDVDRFDQNLDRVVQALPRDMAFRLVVKSLPVPDLITRSLDRAKTNRVMTFNLPMLQSLTASHPKLQHLLGKPFPVAAARAFLETAPPASQVHWLIDTSERLKQYAQLARDRGQVLNVCLELDIGLHRGGFTCHRSLGPVLERLRDIPELTLTGVMGYDAHVGKAPAMFGLQRRSRALTERRFIQALDIIRTIHGMEKSAGLIRNGGGSPTLPFYTSTNVINDISAGSILVKPTDFDLPHLERFSPAAFIATPALKVLEGVRTPVIEWLDRVRTPLRPGARTSVFVHGGFWKAKPVHPKGLKYDPLIGRSSNQELLTGPARLPIKVDDFVFFRPTQSEAVLMQFGPIATVKDGQFAGWIDPLPVSA